MNGGAPRASTERAAFLVCKEAVVARAGEFTVAEHATMTGLNRDQIYRILRRAGLKPKPMRVKAEQEIEGLALRAAPFPT
jgi:DNA-binding phage protein